MPSKIYSTFQLHRKQGSKHQCLQATVREATCKSERTLDDFKSEQSKGVNCINKDKPSSNKHKQN